MNVDDRTRANVRQASVCFFSAFVSLLVSAGCGMNEGNVSAILHPPVAAIPIAAAQLEVGTFSGTLRRTQSVEGFQISKTPVTRGQYDRCVGEQVCQPPAWTEGGCAPSSRGIGAPKDGVAASDPQIANTPMTCVSPAQALTFCRWDGGRLPTANEWLLAARGPKVRRYAWGDINATCAQHPQIAFSSEPGACCDKSCDDVATAIVGLHEAGASPYGLQDILITHGELVTGHSGSVWGGCSSKDSYCVVTGTEPGAIDAFVPVSVAPDADKGQYVHRPVSFRCVDSGGAL